MAVPHALRSVVVYGPNASGKSSMLRALDYMRAVVAESATVIQPGQTCNLQPFKLDPATAHRSTEFEITFLLSGVRHQYAFAMTPQRIVSESLLVYRSSKPTQFFSRQHVGAAGDGARAGLDPRFPVRRRHLHRRRSGGPPQGHAGPVGDERQRPASQPGGA